MNDRELVDYIETHAQTELGQTHLDHVTRLLLLAGRTADHLNREWYFLRSSEVVPLVAEARARMAGRRGRDLRTGSRVLTLPSEAAQERYPITDYPCRRCVEHGLPHLVALECGAELYWEHQHPGASARTGCPRFGRDGHCGTRPRPGTVEEP